MSIVNIFLAPFVKFIPESNRLELIWKLAQVDFKKRYYHDRLGLFWALLDPILQVITYYIAFQFIRGEQGTGIDNFALFLFSAIIFWKFFAECLNKSLGLVRSKASLLMSIKLNVFDLYYSLILSNLLGLIFNIIAYFTFAYFLGVTWSLRILMLMPLILILVIFSLGSCMIIGTIQVYFQDIKHLVNISLLFGLWTSGVFFKVESVIAVCPEFYYLNPFLGVFENIRNVILYDATTNFNILWINTVFALATFVLGSILLKKNRANLLEFL